MDFREIFEHENVDFSGIESSYFLLGLLSAFDNRFQAMADRQMKEISWKQFFAIICINLCRTPPTIKELAEIIGTSHQNVKQLLLKLEKKDFVQITSDPEDRRKQRVLLTPHCMEYCSRNDEMSARIMTAMFKGIPEEQLRTTIHTIIQIEENIKKIEGESINE